MKKMKKAEKLKKFLDFVVGIVIKRPRRGIDRNARWTIRESKNLNRIEIQTVGASVSVFDAFQSHLAVGLRLKFFF